MLKHFIVCFYDVIENRINDDDIYFDGDNYNGSIDCVYDVFAEHEVEAKEKYLRLSARGLFKNGNKLTVVKRECAARVIRRIVAGEILLLPREVISNCDFSHMITIVYDAVKSMDNNFDNNNEIYKQIARTINLDEYAELLDKESIKSLYVEIYMNYVFAQELQNKHM